MYEPPYAMNYRVAAYITSYQDPAAVQHCVEAIRRQTYPLAEILVVENSAIDQITPLRLEGLVVKHYPENIGISGGLRIAIAWAIEQSYDFLWTFDQDSEPNQDCLSILIENYESLTFAGHKIGTLAPKVIDTRTGQLLNGLVFNGYRFLELKEIDEKRGYYECHAVISSGSLVPISAAKETELPHPDLFIDAVDWDYCNNLRESGFLIVVIPRAILMHRYGESVLEKNILVSKTITINNYSTLRYFYICRNHTYVETRLCKTKALFFKAVIHRFQRLVIVLAKITFYERQHTIPKLWACISGTYYGFFGKLGKVV